MGSVKTKGGRTAFEPAVKGTRLKYQQVKDYLLNQIADGHLKSGDVLPPEKVLAKRLGRGVHTIRHALGELSQENIVRRVQGTGTIVNKARPAEPQQKLDIFALVVPETHRGFYPSLLRGFEAAARGVHHQTLICSTDGDVERQAAIVLQLLDKGVGGVAINPTGSEPTPLYQIRQLQDHDVPVVFCHRRVEGIAAPLLAIPFDGVGRLAGKVLAEHGHRRVAFFGSPRTREGWSYGKGLEEGLRVAGCDVPLHWVDMGVDSTLAMKEDMLLAVLQRVFANPDRPTAMVATFDSVAEMIYLLMPRLGLRVPEDVSLLGFGGASREGALMQRLTSVVVDEIAIGRQAVALLHEMRRGNRPIDDNEETVVEVGLSEGKTLAAPASMAESAL